MREDGEGEVDGSISAEGPVYLSPASWLSQGFLEMLVEYLVFVPASVLQAGWQVLLSLIAI